MNSFYRLVVFGLISTCLIIVAANQSAAQEKPGNPAYDWLKGTWSGPAPAGGELRLDLQVVEDNKVVGRSEIPRGGGSRPISGNVEGAVEGDQVRLKIWYQRSEQNWRLHRNGETLTGTRKGEEVIFKKVK